MPRLEYDSEADALCIELHEEISFDHTTSDVEHSCNGDDGADGVPIGVEFWNVHLGLDLKGVPERDTVLCLQEGHHCKVFT